MLRIALMALFGMCWLSAQAADVRTVQPRVTPAQPAATQNPTVTQQRGALKTSPCGFEGSGSGLGRQLVPTETTVLEAYPMIGAIGDTVPVKAKLRLQKTGKPVPGHTLHFRIGGQLIGSAKTDSQGMARVNYKVPNQMGPKPIGVTYNGSSLCKSARASANFGTVKSATRIELHNNSSGYTPQRGGKYGFRGTLTRITDQAPLFGRELLLFVNGKPVGKTATDQTGRFIETIDVPSDAPNTLAVKAQFEGDDLYAPTAGVIHENVLPPPYTAYLIWQGVTGKVGQTVTVTAMLSKHYPPMPGSGVAGKTVRIWRERDRRWALPHVPSKPLGSATTDAHGVARITFKIDDDAMAYSLYAHADAPEREFTLVKKSDPRYVVQRAPVNIVPSGPNSGSIGSTINFEVTVSRATDGAPVAGERVRVDFSAPVATDRAGHATLPYTVSAGGTGPRTLTFKVDEGERTEAGTKGLPFTATPNTN
jgi:hypothetical protein